METPVTVNIENPLEAPYRTGAYLISDVGSADNFRSAMTLTDHPYRASGSHQLGIADFVSVLSSGVMEPFAPPTLHLVDLREETHGFFDGAPVSWYADNDFGNVGMSRELIFSEERSRLRAYEGKSTQLFSITDDANDDLKQERVVPVSYTTTQVSSARNEEEVAWVLSDVFKPTTIQYRRIPVTDHCAPSKQAMRDLQQIPVSGNDWVHFHCHGGDGRTSTFLCLYDMLCWYRLNARANANDRIPLPPVEEFAARQCGLFSYCLDPDGCGDCGKPEAGWKQSLANVRWEVISNFWEALTTARGNPNTVAL